MALSDTNSALKEIDDLFAVGGMRRSGGPRSRVVPVAAPATGKAGKAARKDDVSPALEVIRIPGWPGSAKAAKAAPRSVDWLVHGFSTRRGGQTRIYRPGAPPASGGDLNLGFTKEDDAAIVAVNRASYLRAVTGKADGYSLVTLKQIHSALMYRVERGEEASPLPSQGDGLMTSDPGVLLGIQTADCIPVLIADKRNRAVAAFHAGWRGTLRRIVESGIGRMRLEFGSRPEDLIAAIGPGIGQCCYSVGEEVRHEFESQFSYASDLFREVDDSDAIKQKYPMLFLTARAPGHSNLGPSLHLDLVEANRRQLLAAGLKATAIHLTGECTGCDTDRFFSHRNEQGFTGRMMAVIGIQN